MSVERVSVFCLSNMDLNDFSSGPGSISVALSEIESYSGWYFVGRSFCCDYSGYQSVRRMSSQRSRFYGYFVKILKFFELRRRFGPHRVILLVYPSLAFSVVDFVLISFFFGRPLVRVIGYDSFYFMNLNNLNKAKMLWPELKLRLNLLRHYLLEFIYLNIAEECYFVSDRCIEDVGGRFGWARDKIYRLPLKPFVNLNTQDRVASVPRRRPRGCGRDGVLVLGRFLSPWMVSDFYEKVMVLSELSKNYDVIVLGAGARSVVENCDYLINVVPLEWIDDFDGFLFEKSWTVLYGPESASGIQTKLQKAVALNNRVVVNYKIDVGPDFDQFVERYSAPGQILDIVRSKGKVRFKSSANLLSLSREERNIYQGLTRWR